MTLHLLGSDKIIRINDELLLGQVQNFDWAPAFNSEDIFELGLETRIASALELETSGSFEVLSIGSTAGIMARMIVERNAGQWIGYKFKRQEDIGDVGVGTFDGGSTTDGTLALQTWDVDGYVGYELEITGGTNVGERRIVTTNSATQIDFAPAMPVAIDATSVFLLTRGNNLYTWTQSDLREVVFDIASHEQTDQATFDRSHVLPRQFLTSISGRADANGSASETFNFAGDFVFAAPAPYHDVRMAVATFTSTTTATFDDITIDNTSYDLAYVYVDEKRFTTTGTPDSVALDASGVITFAGGFLLNTNQEQRIMAVAFVDDSGTPATTFPELVEAGSAGAQGDRGSSAFFMKGYQVNIYIAPATPSAPTSSEQWLRAQSMDWNLDLRVERLRQIAYNAQGTSTYAQLPVFPINITANATVFETDLADWKAILDPTAKPFGDTGTDFYGESYDFDIANLKTNFALVVEYRTIDDVLIQTWRFTDMAIDGYGSRIAVGGRAEVTWSFTGTAFTLIGANN